MREAGVSEETFDGLFESTGQCFLDALDRLGPETLVCATRAFQSSGEGLASIAPRNRGADAAHREQPRAKKSPNLWGR